MSRKPIVPLRLACLVLATMGTIDAQGPATLSNEGLPFVDVEDIDALLSRLSSDSFTARQLSLQRLLALAKQDDQSYREVLARVTALTPAPRDLELSLSRKRLLGQLRQFAHESTVDRFLHDPDFQDSELPGWEVFRRHAGADFAARSMFVSILRRDPDFGVTLAAAKEPSADELPEVPHQSCDFDSIERDDSVSWAMVLTTECCVTSAAAEEASLRLVAALRYFASGPSPVAEIERRVITRLVDSYLSYCPADLRDKITIGTRFGCIERTAESCRSVLNDPTETPSRIVTALLAANAIALPEAEFKAWIDLYQLDRRTSHVWRSVNPPKTTHRTQVGDIAWALHLHRQGVDPRDRGFSALVADPVLIFRAYSLGFETEEKRQASRAASR